MMLDDDGAGYWWLLVGKLQRCTQSEIFQFQSHESRARMSSCVMCVDLKLVQYWIGRSVLLAQTLAAACAEVICQHHRLRAPLHASI